MCPPKYSVTERANPAGTSPAAAPLVKCPGSQGRTELVIYLVFEARQRPFRKEQWQQPKGRWQWTFPAWAQAQAHRNPDLGFKRCLQLDFAAIIATWSVDRESAKWEIIAVVEASGAKTAASKCAFSWQKVGFIEIFFDAARVPCRGQDSVTVRQNGRILDLVAGNTYEDEAVSNDYQGHAKASSRTSGRSLS